MNFCGATLKMPRFAGKASQKVESLKRDAAPGLQPGIVRRVMKWKAVPKVKSSRAVKHPTAPAANPADFCRQARRVRATFGTDRVEMHKQLGQLKLIESYSEPAPVRPRDDWRLEGGKAPAAGWDDPEDGFPRYTLLDPDDAPLDDEDDMVYCSVEGTFRTLVERAIKADESGVLRYSDRLSLLKEAGQRGIARFDANLIIASVENELRATREPVEAEKPARVSGWMIFLTAQSLITAGFWRLVRG